MKTLTPQPFAQGLVFGEGPRWHDGELWLSDMHAQRVVKIDRDGQIAPVIEVPARPSGLGWLPDGHLLVVSMEDRRILRLEGDRLLTHADLSELVGADPNDMVVDAEGRAYVGNFGFDLLAGAERRTAELVLVTPDGKARVVADELEFPNGTVITPDGRGLVVAETFGGRLTRFEVELDGSLAQRRVFADLGERTPDGICLDAEGAIWVSCAFQDEFVRVRDGGEITHRVPVDGRRAIACMLGGSERRTLFLLTAETSIEDLAQGKSVGFVETVSVETPGAGLP